MYIRLLFIPYPCYEVGKWDSNTRFQWMPGWSLFTFEGGTSQIIFLFTLSPIYTILSLALYKKGGTKKVHSVFT